MKTWNRVLAAAAEEGLALQEEEGLWVWDVDEEALAIQDMEEAALEDHNLLSVYVQLSTRQ